MWSIWLWGRQEGQLRPITARCQPRHEQPDRRPPRVHVPGQHGVGPGLGAQELAELGEMARRAVEQVRHVDAHDGDGPAVDRHVDHNGRPSHAVGLQRGAAAECDWPQSGGRGRTRTAIPMLPVSASCQRGRDWTLGSGGGRRPCRAPGCGLASRAGRSTCRSASGWGGMPASLARCCAPRPGSRGARGQRPPARRPSPSVVQVSSRTTMSASRAAMAAT